MVWNGFDIRPLPPAAALSSTNQITGPVNVTLMVAGADVAGGPTGLPVSEIVYCSVCAPVRPGPASRSKVPAPAWMSVIVQPVQLVGGDRREGVARQRSRGRPSRGR